MDQETSKIKHHIDSERKQLGRNLDEIEDRFWNATDLKAHFDKNTGWFLGAAVAGGFLLSLAFGKPSLAAPLNEKSNLRNDRANSPSSHLFAGHLQRVSETLDDVFDGLIAVATDKLHSFVADAVPGYREQYDAIARHGSRSSSLRSL